MIAGLGPVLIVEDDEATAELERRALTRAGITVRLVRRVDEALAALARESFAAVLLDYQLPGGDPWRVVDAAGAQTPRIPVVLVTGMGNERIAAEAIQHGIAEYVQKTGPFLDELVGAVERATKLARVEARLRRADALMELIAQHGQDLIMTTDGQGAITSISPACRRLLGYEPEELIGKTVAAIVHPDDLADTVSRRMSSTGDDQMRSVVRCRRKDGSYVWIESNTYVRREPGTGRPIDVTAIQRDVTERKRAEETAARLEASLRASEAQAKAMLDAIPDLMFRLSAAGVFLDYRAHSTNELSSPPDQIVGGNIRDLMPAAFADECLRYIEAALATGTMQSWEYPLEVRSGLQDYEARMVPSGPDEVLAIVRNVTARKEAERMIRGALREKEVLLQEVHHRVKNNLQVISSLLHLQARQVEDPAARSLLAESRARVQSIALVHEKLYQSTSLSHVRFDEYLRSLVAGLFHGQGAAARGLEPILEVSDVSLAIDVAVPCGLIVNELVTNALRHAFPAGRSGVVRVALAPTGAGLMELIVADDGVGLPDCVDPRNSRSLGLTLVATLARQLGATLEVTRAAGTTIRLAFPLPGG